MQTSISPLLLVKHFLVENDTYVYQEGYFSTKDSFQKKKLLEFVNCMGYYEGVVPSIEVDKNV